MTTTSSDLVASLWPKLKAQEQSYSQGLSPNYLAKTFKLEDGPSSISLQEWSEGFVYIFGSEFIGHIDFPSSEPVRRPNIYLAAEWLRTELEKRGYVGPFMPASLPVSKDGTDLDFEFRVRGNWKGLVFTVDAGTGATVRMRGFLKEDELQSLEVLRVVKNGLLGDNAPDRYMAHMLSEDGTPEPAVTSSWLNDLFAKMNRRAALIGRIARAMSAR